MSCRSRGWVGWYAGILLIGLLAGCGGSRSDEVSQVGSGTEIASPTSDPLSGVNQSLPAPNELVGFLATPRNTSYTEDDLFRYGKFYDTLLPADNVEVIGDGAEFTPTWAPGGGVTDLAYCMFSFPAVGYDRTPALNYGYTVEPGDYSDVWIGLANWADDRWDWFAADASGLLDFSSTANYLKGDGTFLAVFIQTGSSGAVLRWVQLGPPQIDAQIISFTHSGVASLSVEFDASGSDTVFGLITKYEWDWEGDGIYDEDTLGDASTTHVYGLAGDYTPTVRVSTNLGTSATDSMALSVYSPWEHTWGGFDFEGASCIAVDSDGAIYCGGRTDFYSQGKDDVLLLKYDFEGNLLWARAWGGEEDEALTGIAVGGDGSIYAAGYTQSWGEGNDDLLLQQWSADGEVIWSETWGGATSEKAHSLALHRDALYIAGESNINVGETGLSDALVGRFDLAGNATWVRTFGGAYRDLLKSVSVITPFLGDTEIHVVGTLRENPAWPVVLYAQLDGDGNAQTIQSWFGWGGWSSGYSIKAIEYPAPTRIWMAGNVESPTGDTWALLLNYDSGQDGVALAYGMGIGTDTRAYAFLDVWGGYLLGGSVSGVGSNDRAFMLQIADNGATLSCKAYGEDTGEPSSFTGFASFPLRDVVGVGSGSSAADSSWTDFDFVEAGSFSYPWEDPGLTAIVASGTSDTPDGTTMYVTTATIDAGGGNSDALVVTVAIQ